MQARVLNFVDCNREPPVLAVGNYFNFDAVDRADNFKRMPEVSLLSHMINLTDSVPVETKYGFINRLFQFITTRLALFISVVVDNFNTNGLIFNSQREEGETA